MKPHCFSSTILETGKPIYIISYQNTANIFPTRITGIFCVSLVTRPCRIHFILIWIFVMNFPSNPHKNYIVNPCKYRISLNKVRGHQEIQQFQKSKTLNNVPFLCTKLFQKRGHYSRGDIIQGRILIKEIRYVCFVVLSI